MRYYELVPAYGRDYKNRSEVIADWNAECDFEGDYQLDFKLINRQQFESLKPCKILLRYKHNTQIATVVLK